MIRQVDAGWNVQMLVDQLAKNPQLWNEHPERTEASESPHHGVSDIWVRYNPTGENVEHVSEWYPCVHAIPAAWSLAKRVMRRSGAKRLGGVLLTRIPPGGEVKPHIDGGWHAGFYEKYAVQIKGTRDQGFFFDDSELHPVAGDVYTFDNSKSHWVKNETEHERITLIVCVR